MGCFERARIWLRAKQRRIRLKLRPSPYDDETQNAPRMERWLVYAARATELALENVCVLCALASALVALALLYSMLFGARVSETELRASQHYAPPRDAVDSYQWIGNEPDGAVAEHVYKLREEFFVRADLLRLVPRSAGRHESRAVQAQCNAGFSRNRQVREKSAELLGEAERFLAYNAAAAAKAAHARCVCAPLLGRTENHLAIFQAGGTSSNDSVAKHLTDHGMMVAVDGGHVAHFFNPVDMHASEYESLNGPALDRANVPLVYSNETLDYRYNEARGEFTLVRRARVRFSGETTACRDETVTVRGDLAICVQRCFDLLAGIDVRERARRQAAYGIRLNKDFPTHAPESAPIGQEPRPAPDRTEL